MFSLIASNVRYGLGPALNGAAVMLALALGANLLLPLAGAVPPPEDDFKLAYFFPVALVVAGLLAGFSSVLSEVRERRSTVLLALPLTWREVGAVRVLTPLVFVAFFLLLAEAAMAVVVESLGVEHEVWRYLFIAFFAGQFALIPELLLLADELQFVRERSRVMQIALRGSVVLVVVAVGLKVLSRYVAFAPALADLLARIGSVNPESLESNLLVLIAVAVLTVFNYTLFLGRRSMQVG